MILSRSLRRFVASSAAALFLACQGIAIVYAHSTGAPGSSAGAAQGSCHDPGQQTGKNASNSACQANCQSQLTSSGISDFATIDLPAIATRVVRTIAVADSALPAEAPLLRIESPPLLVLHSRLRN
jgi:hypothetical protein